MRYISTKEWQVHKTLQATKRVPLFYSIAQAMKEQPTIRPNDRVIAVQLHISAIVAANS